MIKNKRLVFYFATMCLMGCGSSNTNYETSNDDYEIEEEYVNTEDDSVLEENLETEEYENIDNSYTSSYSSHTPTIYIPPTVNYNPTYHTNSDYQYEYRTGVSGNYNYNYDVSGSDYYGDDVSGNLDMQGKYGSGSIVNANGDEIEVEAEWIDYGTIEATDYYGNTYELTTD